MFTRVVVRNRLSRRAFAIAAVLVLAVGLLAGFVALNWNCQGGFSPGVLHRSTCLYLQTPLVWMAPDTMLPTPAPEPLTPMAVPPGVDPNEIQPIGVPIMALAQSPGPHFGGIQSTWAERSSPEGLIRFVPNGRPFVGALEMGVFDVPTQTELVTTCLIDFVQTPCGPGMSVTQTVALRSGVVQQVPLKTPALLEGLHDLVVVIWQSLDSEAYDPDDLLRNDPTQTAFRTSLAVNGNTTPKAIEDQPLPWPYHAFGLEGFAINPEQYPWDQSGGMAPFSYLRVRPGESFNLYLHLFNRQAAQIEYALSAFMDYAQVPITYRGEDHLPLYFSAKAGAWYAVPISLKAPAAPGHHELVILGEQFPRARLDLESTLYRQMDNFSFNLWSSSRIYLDAVASP